MSQIEDLLAYKQENSNLRHLLRNAEIEKVALGVKVDSLRRELAELKSTTLTPELIEAALEKVLSKRAAQRA